MRIGVVPATGGREGGVYQYCLTILRALCEWKENGCEDEFIVLTDEVESEALQLGGTSAGRLSVCPLRPPWNKPRSASNNKLWRVLNRLMPPPHPDKVRCQPQLGKWFREQGIELMLYPTTEKLSFECGLPFVIAVHDLQHRLQPEFPELSLWGGIARREYVFRNSVRHATLILADSEVGKEDILSCYGALNVSSDRVKVLPFLPPPYLESAVSPQTSQQVRGKYRLPERYLFYPAQFWPHKNHARLVSALGVLKKKYRVEAPIVLCGSHSGYLRERTFREAMSLARRLGVEGQIFYLGYVPNEEMAALYEGAVALVMPTFFGPTNIPVLEAWAFGCPVLTSDIRGIREQCGEAAVLVDPRSEAAIAEGVYRIWAEENLRHDLAEKGRVRLGTYTPEEFRDRLIKILEEAKARLRREEQGSQ